MKVCLSCKERFQAQGWRCPACGESPQKKNGFLSFSPELAKQNQGFGADFFKELARLEAANFWFKTRNRLLVWALRRYFPNASNFLEVGCGTGFVLLGMRRNFPELRLSGSEIFDEGLTFAQERLPDISLFQMDAREIPFENEFDVIGAFDVLEHIEEDTAVLLQIFKATKPGGGAVLTVPQHRFLWSIVDDLSFHKRRYERGELLEKVRQAGFTVLRVTSFVSFLLPAMLVTRLRKRRPQPGFDLYAELKINRHLNAVFEKVIRTELSFIKAGFSFPAGGSLLVVARRDGR